jgi:SAM-dependent methyltransferase
MSLDERIQRLLGYASPYASSTPIEDPPAFPIDFLNNDMSSCNWLFQQRKIQVDPNDLVCALKQDSSPIPATVNREGYNGDAHFTYWVSGYVTFLQLSQIASKYGVSGGGYLDFGGSTGRVFRHFHFQSTVWRVLSCDFKLSSVQWNTRYFPAGIEVFQNSYNPSLPIESNSLSLISAMSVFTHIDETETSWLMELRRTLRPGGLLLATIHDENTWKADANLRENAIKLNPSWSDGDMPEGRRVSTWRIDDPYRCNVFASQSYIGSQWGRFFDVLEIMPCTFGPQTMVVLRKRT